MSFNTNELLRAIEIISKSQVDSLKLDKTIVASISKIINLELGEYQVDYEGNTVSAYSTIPTVTYKVGDSVYVKIPQNDMSYRRIIEGIATGNKTLTDVVDRQTDVNTVGPNWSKFYCGETDSPWTNEFGIVSGVNQNHKNFSRFIWQADVQNGKAFGDDAFRNYSSTYKKIRLSAQFQTRFMSQYTKGNYGLIVTFRVNTVDGSEDTVSYRLDMSNFTGRPYAYNTWAPQSVLIDIQDNYLLGLDSILLFQENFDHLDYNEDNAGRVIYINDGDDDIFNILVKDIELSFVELIDLNQSVYYLTIDTPDGTSFLTQGDALSLEGKLRYQGSDIIGENTCECYWYKQNPLVMIGHEKYDTKAGPGWEPVENNDFNILEVSASDVKYHSIYRLITIYNGITLTREVTLFNLAQTEYNYSLVQETEGERIYLSIKDEQERQYYCRWFYELPDRSYNEIQSDISGRVVINDFLKYTIVEFYCQVYSDAARANSISVEHMTVRSSSQSTDVIVTYDGQDVYQYDANGDIAFEDTEIDRTLAAKVTWQEGFGSAYSITWLAPDGHSLGYKPSDAWTPSNSMMEKLWVDSKNILHYNIRQKYGMNYVDNIITIIITTVDQKQYSFEKEILFLKDGDQGTNGSTYVCAIRPVEINDGVDEGKSIELKALRCQHVWNAASEQWQTTWDQSHPISLKCFVYRNGEPINELNDGNKYNISYEWSCGLQHDDKSDAISINAIANFSGQDDYKQINGIGLLENKGGYLVKAIVRVRAGSETSQNRWDDDCELYCQYPIDIAVNGLDINQLELELPSYIKYTAAGTDPAYQKTPLVCQIKDGDSATIVSTDLSLLTINEDKTIQPVDKFLYREGIAALKCIFSDDKYLLHPVMMYLNTYGNETINGWDGTSLELSNGYYYEENYTKVYLTKDEIKQIRGNKITVNGVEYTVKREDAHILAPQVGAGKKENDGRFTGVIMGRQAGIVQDVSGDTQNVFGLYGYKSGVSTFGLKEDGTAYIGAAGEGQIIFDGRKKGSITSGNYVSSGGTEGMQIELTDGHIDAHNFLITSGNMTLDSANQQFLFYLDQPRSMFRINGDKIKGESENTLFNISYDSDNKEKYYLQTKGFGQPSGEKVGDEDVYKGTQINLSSGTITSYDFTIKTPKMELRSTSDTEKKDGLGKFWFNVGGGGEFAIHGSNANDNHYLFYASGKEGSRSYYLQTDNFLEEGTAKPEGGSVDLAEAAGTQINLSSGTITSYDFTIKTPTLDVHSGNQGNSTFKYQITNKGVFNIWTALDGDYTGNPEKRLIYIKGNETLSGSKAINAGNFFLQSKNYRPPETRNGQTLAGQGIKVDLVDGAIYSYNFQLESKSLDIDSAQGRLAFYLDDGSEKGSSWFRIYTSPKNSDTDHLVFNVSNNNDGVNNFYLKSVGFHRPETARPQGEGTEINISDGKITSYNFTIDSPALTIQSDYADKVIVNNTTGQVVTSYEKLVDGVKTEVKLEIKNNQVVEKGTNITVSGYSIFSPGVYGKFDLSIDNGGSLTVKDGDTTLVSFTGVKTSTESRFNRFLRSQTFVTSGDANIVDDETATTYNSDTGAVGSGVKLDLTGNGKLDAANFRIKTSCMDLDSSKQAFTFDLHKNGSTTEGVFRIRAYKPNSSTLTNVFYIRGNDQYYLRTANYAPTSNLGTKIDLVNGDIQAYQFSLDTPSLTIKSSNTQYIANDKGVEVTEYKVGNTTYELKIDDTVIKYRVKGGSGNWSTAPSDWKLSVVGDKLGTTGTFSFDVGSKGRFSIKKDATTLFQITGTDNYFLQSANYVNNNANENVGDGDDVGDNLAKIQGMKINLKTGKIWAKDVELTGKIKAEKGNIGGWTIDSDKLYNQGSGDGLVKISTSGLQYKQYFKVSDSGLSISFADTKDSDGTTSISSIKIGAEGIKLSVSSEGQISFTGYDGKTNSSYTQLSTYSYASNIDQKADRITLSVSGTTTTLTKYDGTTVTGSVNCYQKNETYTQSQINTKVNGITLSVFGKTVIFNNNGSTSQFNTGMTFNEVYNAIDIGIRGITLTASTSGTSSTLTLKNNGVYVDSTTINFSGLVTFSNLSTAAGYTFINGANIQTGTIRLDQVKCNTWSNGLSIDGGGRLLLASNWVDIYGYTGPITLSAAGGIVLADQVYIGNNRTTLADYIKSFLPSK